METNLNNDDFQAGEEKVVSNDSPEFLEVSTTKIEAGQKHKHPSHNQDFVPHHSNHGRAHSRTFGSNHEPGTII